MFLLMFIILGQRMVDINREQQLASVDAIADLVYDEVSLAQTVRDGYFRRFEVPRTIMGEPYNMSVEAGDLYIRYRGEDSLKVLPQPLLGGFCFPHSGLNYYNITITRDAGIVSMSSCAECRYSYAVCYNAEDNNWCDLLSGPSLLPGFNESCCTDHCLCC